MVSLQLPSSILSSSLPGMKRCVVHWHEKLLCPRCVPFLVYQRKYSAGIFKSYVQRVISILQRRMERVRSAPEKHASGPGTQRERDGGVDPLVAETEGLLSAVLSAHLVLCRVAVLYPWKSPFYAGTKTYFRDETRQLASNLMSGWEHLGVSGVARKVMLKQLISLVGQQTLEARQKINEDHHKQLESKIGTAGGVRSSAALRETSGEAGQAA